MSVDSLEIAILNKLANKYKTRYESSTIEWGLFMACVLDYMDSKKEKLGKES